MIAALALVLLSPDALTGPAAIPLNDKVYLIGGYDEKGHRNNPQTWAYDPKTKLWEPRAPMPTARVFSAVCASNGKIYTLGGIDDKNQDSKVVEVYDPKTDRWERKRDMPFAQTRFAAVARKSQIYTVGGFHQEANRDANHARVDRYDPIHDTWHRLPDMPTPRHALSAVLFKDRIWAIGGYSAHPRSETAVESFDLKTNRWKKEPPTLQSRAFGGLLVQRDSLLAFGALHDPSHSERFTNGKWTLNKGPDHIGRRFGYAEVAGKILIFGGEPPEAPFVREFHP